jgi:poly-gamma-glutamate synthesis protein (capsule biosynthesis protein)
VRAAAAVAGQRTGERFDFGPMFEPVGEVLRRADLAICNMEIPVGRPGQSFGFAGRSPFGGNRLLAPYEVASGLRRAGFDRCSTASNHGFDLGVDGIAWTIQGLNEQGITTVGTARTAAESTDDVFEVDGVKVAHLAFTIYTNTVPPSDPWRLNLVRSPQVMAQRAASTRARGAEIVVVSIHVSVELGASPTAADRALVTQLTALADVDAVFVHGPHVVQPFEIVNGTPVWWSLGNFVSEMGPPSVGRYADPRTADGLLAFADFRERADGGFEAVTRSIAICNDLRDRTVRVPAVSPRSPDLPPRVRDELWACRQRTRVVVPDAR